MRFFITRPKCTFCEKKALSATRTLPLFFFSFISFDCSVTKLKCLKTCFLNPGTYKHKNVRISSAQLGIVMLNIFLGRSQTFVFCYQTQCKFYAVKTNTDNLNDSVWIASLCFSPKGSGWKITDNVFARTKIVEIIQLKGN